MQRQPFEWRYSCYRRPEMSAGNDAVPVLSKAQAGKQCGN